MDRYRGVGRFWALLMLIAMLFPSMPASGRAGPSGLQVDPFILEQMAASTDGTASYFVLFREQADLSAAERLTGWDQRGRFVYDALQSTAESSQARVRRWLQERGTAFASLPINNSLFITTDRAALEVLASFPEVASLRGNHRYPLEPPPAAPGKAFPEGVAWNITKVGADRVWRDFGVKGQGIVVASIDTGVEYTHDALHGSYRCGDGPHTTCWYDPSQVCLDPAVPCDNVGHGTHTMGTMVGDDGPALAYNVGMAPDAQWIACKGCEEYWCSDFALTACANWILAPNGDPANRPHVVNNSWGGSGCGTMFQSSVQAWRAAGIFPAFSAGNSGPYCSSLGSPGDYPESFASGATDWNDNIADFSSRGPSCWGEIKPEVSAPGVDVCSSVPGNSWDCSYSGTSMASPHSGGLVALLWSAEPSLIGDIAATEHVITSTAVCRSDTSCGGEECHNNTYGWGRVDAYAAVQRVASTGELAGTVTDAGNGLPLAGVALLAQGRSGFFVTTVTGAAGTYSVTLPAGTYTVTASLYAYYPQTVTAVLVVTDTTTVQDFALQARPRYVISGTVTEAETGAPLEARISAEGAPIAPAWSDPATGFYSLTLAEGSYNVRAVALLHLSEAVALQADHDQTVNFSLEKSTCALLVDDDANRPDVRSYYTSTLDTLAVPYQVWDVAEKGSPVIEDLLGQWVVLWWTGNDAGAVLTRADESLLQDYLDARGNLFLSSQDYLDGAMGTQRVSAGPGPSPFLSGYLHVGAYSLNSGQSDPLGNGGDPIGQGLGPFLLVPPAGWSDPLRTDDASDDGFGGASSPFRWQGSGSDNSTDYNGGSFKTVFLAWPFEALSGPASRRAVMAAVLDFYGSCQPAGLLLGQVRDANTGEPLEATVVPVPEGRATGSGPQGMSDAQGHFTFTLPAGTYELTIYKAGYEVEVLSGISVPAGIVTRLDVALRTPRLGYAPGTFSWTLPWEGTATATLVLSNTGTAGPLDWRMLSLLGRAPVQRAHAAAQRWAGYDPADRPPPGTPQATSLGQPLAWEYETPLPTARCRSAAFAGEEDSFFVAGGWGAGCYGALNENLRYDAATGAWTPMAPMPVYRTNVQAAVVDGIAYLPGGYSADGYYESSLEAYDIAADAWIGGLAPLPEPRSGAMVAAIGGQVYACGGTPGPSVQCWVYYPALDEWETIAPLPVPNGYGVAFEYGGYLYIVGGVAMAANAFWRYSPATDSWEQGPPLHDGRMSPSVAVYGGDVYVVSGGGAYGDVWSPYATVERYSLSEWPGGGWEVLPDPIPTPGVAAAGGCSANHVRAVGGCVGGTVCAEHQVLDEGRACYRPGAEESPWLTLEPVSGSLAVSERQTVTLHVDAGAVRDPVCYEGQLLGQNNTVYGNSTIPVTLCVTPVADLGKLQGMVQGLGYCDREPAPLYTTVQIEGSGGLTWTVAAIDGTYYRWLHAGTYTVTAGALGHLTQTVQVAVQPAQTTTLDFDLRYLTTCLGLWPAQFTFYAPTGTVVQAALTLTNAGPVALSWQTVEALSPGPFGPPHSGAGLGQAVERSGGPDPFGYTFLDSGEQGGPSFSWVEAARLGAELPITWGPYATITLPFTFTFYGVSYPPTTTLYISPYGGMLLGGYSWFSGGCLPDTYAQYPLIEPFQSWFSYSSRGALYAQVQGTAPRRMLVVEWHDMATSYDHPTDTVTLEVILFEGSNDLLFQYQDVTSDDPYYDGGAVATVGIQGNQSYYLQYSCYEAVLTDSMAICFEPPGSVPGCGVQWGDISWLQVTPAAGQVPGDGQGTVSLLLDTSGLLPGVYQGAVGLLSNDPRRPIVYVPLLLVVGLDHRVYLPRVPSQSTP